MRIEHWASQEENNSRQLDYSNLLACCQGNEGQGKDRETCDVRKKNQILKYSPAQAGHQLNSKIRYLDHCKMGSIDTDFDNQLNQILNLNGSRLIDNRNAVLEVI